MTKSDPPLKTDKPLTPLLVKIVCSLAIAAVVIATFVLLNNRQTIEIADVTRAATLTLAAHPKQRSIHGIRIRIHGRLDGVASISREGFETKTLTGRFDERMGGDWYTPQCPLQYSPSNVRGGAVVIDYEFLDF